MAPIKITVKTLDSRNHEFDGVDDQKTVAEFKDSIAGAVGVASGQQRLIYCGRVLQDDRTLHHYGLADKVIHMVQRPPPMAGGTDRLASAEARARSPAPTPGQPRTVRHIHFPQMPRAAMQAVGLRPVGPPVASSTVRLDLAREMIRRARLALDRGAEGPQTSDQPSSSSSSPATEERSPAATEENTRQGSSGGQTTMAPSSSSSSNSSEAANADDSVASADERQGNSEASSATNTASSQQRPSNTASSQQRLSNPLGAGGFSVPLSMPIGTIQISGSAPVGTGRPDVQASIAQAITGIVQNALGNSLGVGGQRGGAEGQQSPIVGVTVESYTVDADGRVLSHQRSQGGQAGPVSASPSSRSVPSSPRRETPASQQRGQPPQPATVEQPPATNMVAVMNDFVEVQALLAARWPSVRVGLEEGEGSDPIEDDEMRRRQLSFNTLTQAMHYMSHAQHALSDLIVNFGHPPPRRVRARPVVAAFGPFAAPTPPMFAAMRQSAAAGRPQPRSATVTTSSTATSSAGAGATAVPTSASMNTSTTASHPSVTPIVVGIEVEANIPVTIADGQATVGGASQEAAAIHNSLHAAAHSAAAAQAAEEVSQAVLAGLRGQSEPSQPSGNDSSTNASNRPNSGRVEVGRGIFGGPGPQFQAIRAPGPAFLGPPGLSLPPQHDFDPFLPCSSHHLPQMQVQVSRRPRSSSVPQRRPETRNTGNSQRQTFPSPSPPPPSLPQRTINLGQWNAGQGGPPQANAAMLGIDPSLLGLMQQLTGNLQGGNGSPDDANIMNMLQGIVQQVVGAMNGGQEQNALTIAQFLRDLPDYSYQEGESLSTDLLMTMAEHLTFTDLVQGIVGNNVNARVGRLRLPLRRFLLRRVFNLDESDPAPQTRADLDTALLAFFDSIHSEFEDMARVFNAREGVDVAETLSLFCRSRVSEVAYDLINNDQSGNSDEAFGLRLVQLARTTAGQLTALCRRCSNELASMERLLENRLSLVSEGTGPTVRQWTLSTSLGQLRTFAAADSTPDSGIENSIVTIERGAALAQERSVRLRAAASTVNTGGQRETSGEQNDEDEDEDHFVTPRNSPVPMNVENQEEQSNTANESKPQEGLQLVVPPPVSVNGRRFPSDLLPEAVGLRGTAAARPEAWHRAVPTEWTSVIENDSRAIERAREANALDQARPYSDAYLSTQAAKRRKLASDQKPAGSAQEVVAACMRDAIEVTGARPRSGGDARTVAEDVASAPGVVEAAAAEVGLQLGRRLANDPDFTAQRFPDAAKSFANSSK